MYFLATRISDKDAMKVFFLKTLHGFPTKDAMRFSDRDTFLTEGRDGGQPVTDE